MSDIVERLQKLTAPSAIEFMCREAAAEIKRLRAQVAETVPGAAREAEIERLTNENNGYRHDARRLLEGERHLQAEIERLQAELAAGGKL